MATHAIGIRKYVETNKVQYWLLINAVESEGEEYTTPGSEKFNKKDNVTQAFFTCNTSFVRSSYWKIFIFFTIMLNTLITVNCFHDNNPYFIELVVVVHLFCLFFWIDFLAEIYGKVMAIKKKTGAESRNAVFLSIEALSLLPFSLLYVIVERNPDQILFWSLRVVTLLRFYRIPHFVACVGKAGQHHWKIFMTTSIFYFTLFIDVFANFYQSRVPPSSPMPISDWNETRKSEFITFFYFSCVTVLNVGYGDIVPITLVDKMVCAFAMVVGCSVVTGVLTGSLATHFTNKEKRREIFREQYESTVNILKERKIEKKVVEKTSENLLALWRYKRGFTDRPPVQILPLSLQKEMFFDVNFGLLSRSRIFSMLPRSFLRSISLLMRNVCFFPGDTILEPSGNVDEMICVVSGVVEIISEENDETTLFSLTTGSVLGEINLFISIPIRCIVRASTYVEVQVLRKVNFSRLAVQYPEIYRSMRTGILSRLNVVEELEFYDSLTNWEMEFYELSRRKATKRVIHELRRQRRELEKSDTADVDRSSVLSLYVISENIPRVKALPINLIKSKPWILRPNTTLTDLWEGLVVVVVSVVVFVHPCLAGFVRKIGSKTYVYLFFTDIVYIIDIYIQCTTAIERKDHFSYMTSIREIISLKLRTVGFYFDVLAAFQFNVYATLVWPENPDAAYLILSLNRVLKIWRVLAFFERLENNMHSNLLCVIFFKYLFYFWAAVVWFAVTLYLDACPEEFCVENRWFEQTEKKEVQRADDTPCSEWPVLLSLYFAFISVSAIGYGDVAAKSIADCLIIISIIISGTVLLALAVAQTSSAVKNKARLRTSYQEEVFAVDRFITEHDLSKELQLKVRNYLQLQWNYDKAFSLHQVTSKVKLGTQHKRIIIMELVKILMTVPLFKNAKIDFLKLLAKSCKLRVLPPNERITDAGSFFREMYILENGYCEVSEKDNSLDKRIIGPYNSFGFLEMILGVPLDINVETLTHTKILSLDYFSYMRAVTKHPTTKTTIDKMIETDYKAGARSFDLLDFKSKIESGPDEITLKFQKELLSRTIINVYKYQKTISKNYWEPFRAWGKFRFLQFLLMPFVIVPHCLFIKIWMTIRITCVLIIGILAPIHFSLPHLTKELLIIIMILQSFAWIDMYLMFHVAYYDRRGILMFHPAKTATWYLTGNFTLDLITVFPLHLVITAAFPKTDRTPNLVYGVPGLIMVFQIYKFFQACHYLEKDILRRTENIKILKFIPAMLIFTNLITGLVILLECYNYENTIEPGISRKENAFQVNVMHLCSSQNGTIPNHGTADVFKLYVTAFYWIAATTTTCGFGDINAYNKSTMIYVMVVALLGIVLYTYMFASLTGSMISAHNAVSKHRRRIREMMKLMKEKNVSHDLQRRFFLHYEYNWQRTEGGSPQKMLTYVYAALRENIMASMYEGMLRQIPAFLDVEKSVVRVIGKNLDEIYFLRGETIVKYNDIQDYIYLIYRGKVDVLSEKGQFITTMGSGGLFGNISKKPFSLSSIVVVATQNVEILRLNYKTFFKALQVFPNTKSLVDYLKSQKHDYLEPLKEASDLQFESHLNLSQMQTIPYETASTSDPPMNSKTKVSVTDLITNKKYFHAKKSIFKIPGQPCHKFIILPDSLIYVMMGVSVLVLGSFSCILTIYMFAFQDFSIFVLTASYFMDAMFLMKIFLQCNVSYFDKFGDYVISRRAIQSKYLKSKKALAFDIAANTPLEIIVIIVPVDKMLLALSILRLNRTLRLRYAFDYYEAKAKVLMTNKIYLELSWMFIYICLMIHIFACVWYMVACPLDNCVLNSWVSRLSLTQEAKWKIYLVSIYYVISVITTTGYGDIVAVSTEAMLVAILFMILSRFVLALQAGAMAAVINVQSIHVILFQERIWELNQSFKQNMSQYQMIKMWKYVTSLWYQETGKQIPKFISTSPYAMKCEVMNEMFGNHLSQCYIFAEMDSAFLRQLAICLKRFVYFPGNYIVQQGDTDHTMYFIHKGQVSVLTIHANLTETVHFTLERNDHFGMTQGLTHGQAHFFSYRAETNVEILSLTLSDWQHLLKYFPDIGQNIYKRLNSLPQESLANENIISLN